MINYVFDEHRHLTGFQMLFPDSEIKPAFLLTSLSDFTQCDFETKHLRQHGLRRDVDYFVVATPDLPADALGWYNSSKIEVPGRHNNIGDRRQGSRRTVLSLTGMLKLVTRARTDFGDRLCDWLYDEVVPSMMRDQFNNDPMLQELRDVVVRMGEEISDLQATLGLEGTYGDLTLNDLVGTAVEVAENQTQRKKWSEHLRQHTQNWVDKYNAE